MTDYTLFPIKKTDVDWALYHLVAHFMKHRYDLNGITDGDGTGDLFKPLVDDEKQEERKFNYHLIFPDEELTISYPAEMLEHEAVIVKIFFTIEHIENAHPYLGEDDPNATFWYEEPPLEYFHYEGTGNNLSLKLERDADLPKDYPITPWNGDTFAATVGELLDFLRKHELGASPWAERLQMVQRMLEGEVNELHILHNAGLYDHKAFWKWLAENGILESEMEDIRSRYVSELKRCAMFVFNELDWRWGSVYSEGAKENRTGLFGPLDKEKLAFVAEEKERRKKLAKDKLEHDPIKMPPPPEKQQQPEKPKRNKTRSKKIERILLIVTGALAFLYLAASLVFLLL